MYYSILLRTPASEKFYPVYIFESADAENAKLLFHSYLKLIPAGWPLESLEFCLSELPENKVTSGIESMQKTLDRYPEFMGLAERITEINIDPFGPYGEFSLPAGFDPEWN